MIIANTKFDHRIVMDLNIFERILCPSCRNPVPAWSMKCNEGDDESYLECYSCDCGCDFTVEARLGRRTS